MKPIPIFPALMLVAAGALAVPAGLSAQKRQRDVITREELSNSGQKDQDLYAAIRSLRPHFLAPPRGVRTMGAAPPAPVAVYVDDMKSDLSALRSIPASDALEVRYLEPGKAQDEFGTTHSGGAILVKTTRKRE